MTTKINEVDAPVGQLSGSNPGRFSFESDPQVESPAVEPSGAADLPVDQTFPRLLYELAIRLPALREIHAVCVWLYEPVQRAIRPHLLMADLPRDRRASMTFPIDDSIATCISKHREPLTINTENESRFLDFAKVLLESGMKSFCGTALRGLVILQFFLAANSGMLCAQSNFSTEGVTCRTNRTLVQRGGEWTLLDSEMTMPGGIKVFTNGTFQINDGKARDLQEGQILRPDGNLLNPDGSIMPVFDHLAMSGATVKVFKDGKGQALTDTLILPDGTSINPDGTYARPNGRRSRLVDGQLLTLEGVPMPVLDTISFRNGKVVVYKSGALIPLPSPNVILGMYDGTRVGGDGLITFPNGTTSQMAEGETITVEGVRADW